MPWLDAPLFAEIPAVRAFVADRLVPTQHLGGRAANPAVLQPHPVPAGVAEELVQLKDHLRPALDRGQVVRADLVGDVIQLARLRIVSVNQILPG